MARATKNTPAPSSRGKSTPKKQRGKEEEDHLSLPVQRQRRSELTQTSSSSPFPLTPCPLNAFPGLAWHIATPQTIPFS